ncbi:MAG: hypothetical protein AAF221_07930, partial [Pseudomonadota bacterium]
QLTSVRADGLIGVVIRHNENDIGPFGFFRNFLGLVSVVANQQDRRSLLPLKTYLLQAARHRSAHRRFHPPPTPRHW